MANRRINRYSRRISMSSNKKKAAPIVICVTAFVLLCLVISIAVGVLLGRRADGTDRGGHFDFDRVEYISNGKKVRSVEAYRLPRGHSASDYVRQGINDLSVKLRNSEGDLEYYFTVGEELGINNTDGEHSFSAVTEGAHSKGGYVCAYIYITSFDSEDEKLREVYKAYELSLIAEAAERGADDILLLGLDVTDKNISELEEFVTRAVQKAGDAVLGVALSEEIFRLTEKDIYYAGRLRSACDYVALDLTHLSDDDVTEHTNEEGEEISRLDETLENCEYYIRAYSARLIFSEESREVYRSAVASGVVNFQIVGK